MIGSGLRKFAQERNLVVGYGVAYGLLNGYCATFSEGGGWKKMTLSTRFADATARLALQGKLAQLQKDIQNAYGVQTLTVSENRIDVIFTDTVGTMNRIEKFVNWFFPVLEQAGVPKADICPVCGTAIIGGRWKLVGDVAMCVHEACGQKLQAQVQDSAQARKDSGSYARGAAGALLGAAGGALAWALLYVVTGRIYALVGLLMGFLANKCYDLFRGKQTTGKIVILVIAVILGVLLGNYAALVYQAVDEFNCSVGDGIAEVNRLLETDQELSSAFTQDCMMGLLFAAIGVFALFAQAKKAVATPKYIDLD